MYYQPENLPSTLHLAINMYQQVHYYRLGAYIIYKTSLTQS